MDLRQLINQQPVIGLSPMDGITDEPFRLIQTEIAQPDVIFTEFVSAEGISRGGFKLYDQLLYKPQERPIIGQLFGKDPQSFYAGAIILAELGFDGIDINMGCPAKTVTANGSGAALIENPQLASEIIKSVANGINDWHTDKNALKKLKLKSKLDQVILRNQKYSQLKISSKLKPTLSVKTRLGINESIIDQWIPHLLKHPIDFLTIHGRTLKQGYAGQADWQQIGRVVRLAKGSGIKIWGNGDVQNRTQAQDYLKEFGVDGILIGRSAMGNPWVFSDHLPTVSEKYRCLLYHAQIYQATFPLRRFDSLRKNFLSYAVGLPNAKQLRQKLVHINNISDIIDIETDFLSSTDSQ